jgi:zinc protease
MKFQPILLMIAVLALAAFASAQKPEPAKPDPAKMASAPGPSNLSVKDILERYIKALGGREAIEKIKSRTTVGTVELVPVNMKGTFESYSAPEARSYSKTSLTGVGDFIESSDGKSVWSSNPIQGLREKSGAELAQAKLTNDFHRDLRLDKLFPKMELKGIEKIGDKEVYVVEGTAEGVPSETWYFDVKSGLMLRSDVTSISPEGQQKISAYLEEIRPVDGVMVPFRIRTQTPQFQIVITFTEVKHNVPIDDAKFAKPKQ